MMDYKEHDKMLELAQGLKNSNELSVSELAEAYIDLRNQWDVLYNMYISKVNAEIMEKHHDLLERLDD